MSTDHSGLTVWFTGLSGSGKSTLSRAVFKQLAAAGRRVELLDGDDLRLSLSRGLGFSKQDRDENVRRLGCAAQLLAKDGVIALVAAISPYRAARQSVRESSASFLEVYVNAPLAECERRDPKGLYKRARAGQIERFTGVSDPYEAPAPADLECRTDQESVEESAARVMDAIAARFRLLQ
jgi:adenylyl-sulfate kinase